MEPTPVYDDSALRLAQAKNILHVRIKDVVSVDHIARIDSGLALLAPDYPKGFALMATMNKAQKAPPADLREAATAMLKRYRDKGLFLVFVLEEEGVVGALTRAVANTIFLAAHLRHTKVFATIPPAAEWLAAQFKAAGAVCPTVFEIDDGARIVARAPKAAPASTRLQPRL